MKNTFRLFLLLMMFAPFAYAQHHHNPDKAAILQVIKKQQASWNNGNIDGFMEGYWNSPELRFLSKNGLRYGWQSVMDNYKKNYDTKEKMGQLVLDILTTELFNNESALVIVKWKVMPAKQVKDIIAFGLKKYMENG